MCYSIEISNNWPNIILDYNVIFFEAIFCKLYILVILFSFSIKKSLLKSKKNNKISDCLLLIFKNSLSFFTER